MVMGSVLTGTAEFFSGLKHKENAGLVEYS